MMKYMGSKSRIAKHIYELIEASLSDSDCYVEPFAGGMNMISFVADRFDGEIIASDVHEYLIEMWAALRAGWEPPHNISRESYYQIKSDKDSMKHLTGWVGFNCSYAGKWFDGYAGVTKTKSGIRDYQLEARKNTLSQVDKLLNVDIRQSDYRLLEIPDNAVVYCDPPYASTRKYRDAFNSNEFWQWVRELSKRCRVFVSEYSAPDDFVKVWSKELTSSISANHQSGTTTKSVEAVFVHASQLVVQES